MSRRPDISALGPLPEGARVLGLNVAGAEKAAKRSKYGAIRSAYGGRTYDSKAEARRAADLDLMVLAGAIAGWEPQVAFRLGPAKIAYRVDFLVFGWGFTGEAPVWCEDIKGVETQRFRVVKKLWAAHGLVPLHVIGKGGTEIVRGGQGR